MIFHRNVPLRSYSIVVGSPSIPPNFCFRSSLAFVVCLHCGFAEFAVPEREMQVVGRYGPFPTQTKHAEFNTQPTAEVAAAGVGKVRTQGPRRPAIASFCVGVPL
jgi:hypothetical protein